MGIKNVRAAIRLAFEKTKAHEASFKSLGIFFEMGFAGVFDRVCSLTSKNEMIFLMKTSQKLFEFQMTGNCGQGNGLQKLIRWNIAVTISSPARDQANATPIIGMHLA